jgi:hypothetical protein
MDGILDTCHTLSRAETPFFLLPRWTSRVQIPSPALQAKKRSVFNSFAIGPLPRCPPVAHDKVRRGGVNHSPPLMGSYDPPGQGSALRFVGAMTGVAGNSDPSPSARERYPVSTMIVKGLADIGPFANADRGRAVVDPFGPTA